MTNQHTKPGWSADEKGTDRVSVACVDCGITRIGLRYVLAKTPRCRRCAPKAKYAALGKTPENKEARVKAARKKSYQNNKDTYRNWVEKNRTHLNKLALGRRERIRAAALVLLGGACVYCGEDDFDVLHIDHIHDDGSTERKQSLSSAVLPVKILKGKVDISRYQPLCCNCNWRKELKRRRKHLCENYDLVS